jgi:molybdenum cofactor cytidylyltransferase
MPVDPGNLLLLAELAGKPVLGAPGCARSPKENGFDWVSTDCWQVCPSSLPTSPVWVLAGFDGDRLAAPAARPDCAAATGSVPNTGLRRIILAAGRGTRMGGPNKLMQEVGGKPMLATCIEAAKASDAWAVLGVTGHEAAASAALFDAHGVTHVHNADYRAGLSSSLRVGYSEPAPGCGWRDRAAGRHAAGDAGDDRSLIAAYDPVNGAGSWCPR